MERTREEGVVEGGEERGGAAEGRRLNGGYESGEESWGQVDILLGKVCQDLGLQSHGIAPCRAGGMDDLCVPRVADVDRANF